MKDKLIEHLINHKVIIKKGNDYYLPSHCMYLGQYEYQIIRKLYKYNLYEYFKDLSSYLDNKHISCILNQNNNI